MVDGEIIHVCAGDAKNGAVPVQIVVAHRNQADRGVDGTHRGSIAVEVVRIRARIAVAAHPSSPNFVANFPVFHPERFGMAIDRSHGTIPAIGGARVRFQPPPPPPPHCSPTLPPDRYRSFRAAHDAELSTILPPQNPPLTSP